MTYISCNLRPTADIGRDTTIDVEYKWNALGRRVCREDSTSPSGLVQVGQQTSADNDAGIAASTPKSRYVYATYIDDPVLRYDPSATVTLYYHRFQKCDVNGVWSSWLTRTNCVYG